MHGMRPVTLHDVATTAGVSVATVSKALNGTGRVSPDTRVRVTRIATDLGYRPNPLARSLVTGRPSTVGMLIRDSRIERFALPIMVGAEEALSDVDLSLIVCDAHGDPARVATLLDRLNQRKVDGVLVVGDSTAVHPSVTAAVDAPVVYVYHETDDPDDVAHLPDDRGGAALATAHLLATGRRRVVHVTGPRTSNAVAHRVDGVRDALTAAGVRLAAPVAYGPWSQLRARDVVGRLLRTVPDLDAVVCGSDQVASGAVDALLAAGRRVPEDVAVTGFDNWAEFAEDTAPALTTVDMDLPALGAAAARDLFERHATAGGRRGVHRHPCSLVLRGSAPASATRAARREAAAVS